MMIHTDIRFTRQRANDGFGFACMRAAYQFGITGRMDYNHEVIIQAEGEESKILEFIEWIKVNVKEQTKIHYKNSLNYYGKYKEFDIFRHNSL